MIVRLAAIALLTVTVFATAAFVGQQLSGEESAPGHYSGDAISFNYPAAWQQQEYEKQSSFSSAIVFLSSDEMHEPCVESSYHVSCGWPVDQVEPGGVVIEWSADAFPGIAVDDEGPSGTTVAGRAANVGEDAPGNCEHLGADLHVHAVIARHADGSNWFKMSACLRGPGLEDLRHQVYAMLESLTIEEELFGAESKIQ